MLESLVAWVLNSYIGEYFGNVNTDQLSVALHQGEVELEGLPLKVESLRHWGLPVDVKAGYIGKIRVKIPVYRIRSEPWVISVEELYVVAHSLTEFTYNETVEKQSMQDYKLSLLDALEMRWKSQFESSGEQSYYESSYTSWLSFGATFVSSIIENVQLNIKSVHIRYEDTTSVKGSQIACGFVIRNLYAQSADKDLDSLFANNETTATECMRKAVSLDGFDFYWDTSATLIGDLELPDIIDWMRILMNTCVNEYGAQEHSYILSSVCGKAQFTRNLSERPLRSRSRPRLSFDLVLERFPLTLNIIQYKQMLEWTEEFSRTSTLWKYRKWRPTVPIRENVTLWWQYGANAHLEQWKTRNKCRNWSFVMQRVKDILKYKEVYYIYLTKPETITVDMKEMKDRIECEFTFEEISIIRELVYSLVKKSNKSEASNVKSDTNSSWTNWLTNWYSPQALPDNLETEVNQATQSEADSETIFKKESFEDRFIFDSIENETFLKRDSVFSRINLIVEQASFTLVSDISLTQRKISVFSPTTSVPEINLRPILELEFRLMRLWIEWRPRVRSYKFEVKLKGLYVKDKISENPIFEYLVSPQKQNSSFEEFRNSSGSMLVGTRSPVAMTSTPKLSKEGLGLPEKSELPPESCKEEYLFDFIFEKKPLSAVYATEVACCKKVFVRSRPLEIIYNHKAFDAFINFFVTKKLKSQQLAKNYEELKRQTKANIQSAVDDLFDGKEEDKPAASSHFTGFPLTEWTIFLDISAPQIIIPEDLLDLSSTLIIFDLGRLQFRNTEDVTKQIPKTQDLCSPSISPVDDDSDSESKNLSVDEVQKIIKKSSYDHFFLDLSDMQVLVVKAGYSWQFLLGKGCGPMHVLNRFCISLQMERRHSYIDDLMLPRVSMKCTLPKLAAYVNEEKLSSLIKCVNSIMQKISEDQQSMDPVNSLHFEDPICDSQPLIKENANISTTSKKEVDTFTLFSQLFISEVTVAIQSHNENLVELQVFGVEVKYQRKRSRNQMSLCVHGLLLIDAHQKSGNEFDVLIASHRDVRIVNSECDHLKRRMSNSSKTDYLISADYVVSEQDYKQSISVLFNSLDIVANQERIIELVKFFEQIIPREIHLSEQNENALQSWYQAKESHLYHTDLRFDFKRLNILLLRASYFMDGSHMSDRKLATATLSGTMITARIRSSDILIEGSLNALHVIDLVDDISLKKHQRVLSIATEIAEDDLVSDDSVRLPIWKWQLSNEKALKFVVKRNNLNDTLNLSASISSLCYDHSTKLFRELTLCATEFKYYLSVIVSTIKQKATKVAMEIVSKAKQNLDVKLDENKDVGTHETQQKKQSSVGELVVVLELAKINTRFSYNDFALIAHILNSLPKETEIHFKTPQSIEKPEEVGEDVVFALPSHLIKLQSLGFSKEDCIQSLEECRGNLNDAALWLTQNAKTLSDSNEQRFVIPLKLNIVMSICVGNGVLCLIDDCKDTDVPLFELGFAKLELSQKASFDRLVGQAKSVLTCDYYNRYLSGWEPLLEPWKSDLNWEYELRNASPSKLSIGFDSDEPLNFVITSTFLDLYKTVHQNWVEDYNQLNQSNTPVIRQHSPFVPFAIKNDTGCRLYFYTVMSSGNDISLNPKKPPISDCSKIISYITGTSEAKGSPSAIQKHSQLQPKQKEQISNEEITLPSKYKWILVEPGDTIPFSFEDQSFTRHQNLHVLESHKIVVKIDGWHQVFPVSIDKVGIYFREAQSEELMQTESARIVFDITLESNARKLITLRSALLLYNGTPNTIEVQFSDYKKHTVLYLLQDAIVPVPLSLIRSQMCVRPCESGFSKCKQSLRWEHVKRPGESSGELIMCSPLSVTGKHSSYSTSVPYFVSVLVNRLNFPKDSLFQHSTVSRTLPGHLISLLPPVKITNLLPYELRFTVENSSISGNIKAGKHHCVQFVDTTKEFSLYFSLDNFPKSKPLTIIPGAIRDATVSLVMFDRKDRPLTLQAQVTAVGSDSSALTIIVFCRYWFINRTGLPLIFKQEGVEHESAGQFQEHEVARCIVPLMFSFLETETSLACKVRLGKSLGRSCWTNSFYLHKGTRFRRLRIASSDQRRPDTVYEIGINVENGRGRYRSMLMVTFSPRYQIENTSSHRLEIIQQYIAYSVDNVSEHLISVLPNSNVAFQWSRSDQDKLLCVRIATIANCHWCGGFAIEPNSFHINIRDESGKSNFIRVEILLEGATFFVVFSDAINLPPPIRVDNFSEVPIEFYQTNISHTWMKTTVRPRSSCPYAWDESTLKPYITACAPGGCSATYNMNSLRAGDNLTYENFFYIAFTGTFLAIDEDNVNVFPLKSNDIRSLQLVLDVPEGSREVILSVKEPGRRSQLWRIGSDGGRIHHEGSSPPRDPRKSFRRNDRMDFVLDISNPCVMPGDSMPLMIRRIDNQRGYTQFWTFTKSGRLVCEHPNLCVQPKNGFLGLQANNIAVLGPVESVTYSLMPNGTPFEQAIGIQKMRKGSGMLSVQVVNDGPTRVLQIVDVRNVPLNGVKTIEKQKLSVAEVNKTVHGWLSFELNLNINAAAVGLSLINKYNEELIYASLNGVIFEYNYKLTEHFLNCSVRYFQVDNQLKEAEKAVVLYCTELDAKDPLVHMPMLSVSIHKLILPQVDIEFFERFQVKIRDITLCVEELLLLKLFQYINFPQMDTEMDLIDEKDEVNTHKAITSALSKSPRLYFTTLEIELNRVKLTVLTTSHLPTELSVIKKKAGLRLIRFEDVFVQLLPFQKNFSLETLHFLLNAIFQHYKDELKSQSAKILGAVDFLGNPLGFYNDVMGGVNGLLNEGNVHGLITNIAHGISDSTVKFTSALSDSLGVVAMDARHDEIRKRIKQDSSDHIQAGIRSLGVGILGGFMSIITQTYSGATNGGGVNGMISGFGKGIIGTFTKPAIGMLDFATGAASVIRESSRKISNNSPVIERVRQPRQCCGISAIILPRFDSIQAEAQSFFSRSVSDKDDGEVFVSFQLVNPGDEFKKKLSYAVIITNEKVRFLSWENNLSRGSICLSIGLQSIIKCQTFAEMNVPGSGIFRYFIILSVNKESHITTRGNYQEIGEMKNGRLRIEAIGRLTAVEVTEHINCAKTSFDERKYTLFA